MRLRSLAPALAAAALALTACSSSGSSTAAPAAASSPAADSSSAQPGSGSSAPAADASAPAKPAAPSDAGLPPKPDSATVTKLVAALDAIDPDIVSGRPDQAVDRARSQCQAIYNFPKDKAKLIDLTNQRFTSSKHPDGFGAEKAEKILAAVQADVCPR
ncbi:hypothetical protein [Kitasatospora sp. GP82]|uniref:hypothetical protein n=1 Tax=Kitasatospora sp. GP82 TaxID=3035089 RepID=UPI002476153C|nr:hypothetical protein [Kitasatospora sp. GP82]MDH6124697.1 putative lipid-binding transport protein (Tim44 family) [Kitasatospora sp. GP82]